jgi:hypothetical protein
MLSLFVDCGHKSTKMRRREKLEWGEQKNVNHKSQKGLKDGLSLSKLKKNNLPNCEAEKKGPRYSQNRDQELVKEENGN